MTTNNFSQNIECHGSLAQDIDDINIKINNMCALPADLLKQPISTSTFVEMQLIMGS